MYWADNSYRIFQNIEENNYLAWVGNLDFVIVLTCVFVSNLLRYHSSPIHC